MALSSVSRNEGFPYLIATVYLTVFLPTR